MIPLAGELLVHRLGEADDAVLGRRVDAEARRRRCLPATEDMLTTSASRCSAPAARSSVQRLAVEEDHRAQVERQLQVDVLGLELVDRAADPQAGVVDEDVEAAEALAVGGDGGGDLLRVGDVRRRRGAPRSRARRSSAAARSSFAGVREVTVRSKPSSASIVAIASPIPLEAPVTSAARVRLGS